MLKIFIGFTLGLIGSGQVAFADSDAFKPGHAIPQYGMIAPVAGQLALPADAKFKISFDVAKAAQPGEVSRALDSVARFINMHRQAGVTEQNIDLAVVVHGAAVKDMTLQAVYQGMVEGEVSNRNIDLIESLRQNGVKFYVCGQSAAYYDVKVEHLLPGVNMSLSAMTAHALLQQQGYTLNPF